MILRRLIFSCLLLLPLAAPADAPSHLGGADPARALFPDSSLADFRHLLDRPAGRYGFLKTASGKFVWPNGRRAKFWGVNISRRSVFVDRPTIDRVIDVLARAGTNMVRFEALDSVDGLLDVPGSNSSRALNAERMETLDYWTAKLRARGIYYYFDLLDFRQFKEGDGVPAWDRIGRAARPYAFFDRRLIELQKEFAEQLLLHKNRHTGLRYVDDPALALVELCNEHGLFFKAGMLDDLVEPYGSAFRQDWNRWLVRRYGSRENLRKAWGRLSEVDVLGSAENPNEYTVKLPLFTVLAGGAGPGVVDVRRAPARLRDGVQYLYDVQRAYFREMKSHLRQIGLRVPVTGVVSNEFIPDVASAAAELDFTSENYYADHPAFSGAEWKGQFFYNNTNPLRSSSVYQVAPWLAGLRWNNKPVVVREWTTVWPNSFRAISVPEMAAYASLQDFDAVLLFGYSIAGQADRLSDFDHQADTPVWGLYALGAQTFLRGDVAPARHSATLRYTPETLYRWPNMLGGVHRLSWFVRLNSMVETASSAAAARSAPRRLASRAVKPSVRRGLSPALSVWPGGSGKLDDHLAYYRAAGAPVGPAMLETGVLTSANGQIRRDQKAGRLTVSSPRSAAVCGELPPNRPVTAGPFTLTTPTQIGALMAVSLDGRPLATSRHYVVKMVSRAENTGQKLVKAPPGAPGRFHLEKWGSAPVKTLGKSQGVTALRRGSRTLLTLGLKDGTWELFVKNGRATLHCDTPNIRGSLFGQRFVTAPGAVATAPLGNQVGR